jgi:alpha-glucosidase
MLDHRDTGLNAPTDRKLRADYVAEIYRDGAEADWQERPLDIEITSVLVDSSTQMSLRLAPAGGQAIRFRPATDEETNSLSRYGQED